MTGPPPPALTAGIDGEVTDLGRFLGTAASWEWTAEL